MIAGSCCWPRLYTTWERLRGLEPCHSCCSRCRAPRSIGRKAWRGVFSTMAVASVLVLVLAGVVMAYFYVASWKGLYGTSYGVLLLAKIYLLTVVLVMGGGNWLIVQRLDADPQPLLLRLRRFAEGEVGLGFTIILAAASMSAQTPAVDVTDQVSLAVIAARMHPKPPRLRSPAVQQLTPPTSIETAVKETEFQPMGGKR